jgi:dTDP-4-amino-4,6-dideoxy-D-galactose acyltransferase
MKVDYLSWDSKFFSKEIYKVTVDSDIQNESIFNLNEINADLLYIFVSNPNRQKGEILEKLGAKLYDRKVTYAKKVCSGIDSKFTVNFKSVKTLTASVENMAYQSGVFSRFKLDPKLSSYFEQFYFTWISKSVKREIADEVIVAIKDEKEVGFITLTLKDGVGKIGLIAVDSKFRGLKIASQLLAKAELWFSEAQIEYIEVITQADNLPACSLYEKNRFVQTKQEYIYHYWKS